MTIYYLMAGSAFYQIEARTAKRAKQIYRELFGLRKMPSGSVISSDRECGFFGSQPNFETLN